MDGGDGRRPEARQTGRGGRSEGPSLLWDPRFHLAVAALLGLLVVVHHFQRVERFAVDVPLNDDYDAILDHLNRVRTTPGTLVRLGTFFEQHNEHRIALPRALFVTAFALEGRVDFRVLALLGNVGLVAVLALLFLSFTGPQKLFLLPVGVYFLQPVYWDCLTWATGTVQYHWVMAFALLSLVLLREPRLGHTLAALAAAVCATFTMGNGLFVFPAGLLLLAGSRRWRDAAVWGAGGMVVAVFYFWGFSYPSYHPSPWDALREPLMLVAHFFALVGAVVNMQTFAVPFGLAVVAGGAWVWTTDSRRGKNAALWAAVVFVLLSILALVVNRLSWFAIAPRYKVYTVLLHVLLYLIYTSRFERLRRPHAIAALAVLVGAVACHAAAERAFEPKLEERARWLKMATAPYPGRAFVAAYPEQDHARAILDEAVRLGTYRPE